MIKIYTDGSHLDKQNGGRLGCGGVMVRDTGNGFGELLDKFGEELRPEDLKELIGTGEVSNPTAELLGVLLAIERFDIPRGEKVTVYADYMGVSCWLNGKWRIKEPYIQIIANKIKQVVKKKRLSGNISYEWVKGHQGRQASLISSDAYWNEYTDHLAKGIK